MVAVLSAVGPGWRGSSQPGGGGPEEVRSELRGQARQGPGLGRGRSTHRAVAPARQDPQVVHPAVHLQPGVRRQGRVRVRLLHPHSRQGLTAIPRSSLAGTHASLGPPWLRSKTCRGLRYQRKDWMILAPCGRPGGDRGQGGGVRGGGWRCGEARGCGNQAQEGVKGGDGIRFSLKAPGKDGWGGCAYLVASTLGVHKHQQGLHEGRRGGPDDEGSPAALLRHREHIWLVPGGGFPILSRAPCVLPPDQTSRRAWLRGGHLDLTPTLFTAPEPKPTRQWLSCCISPEGSALQEVGPSLPFPSSCPQAPGLTSGPFLLDFLLKDALFFFLLALRVFCKGSRFVGDKAGGPG